MGKTVGKADKQERTDLELLSAAQEGDYKAFEKIVIRYQERAYRLALSIVRSPEEAEEAVQDAFLTLFKSLDSFRGESSPGTWIYRIITNASLMRLRVRRRKPSLSIEDLSHEVPQDAVESSPLLFSAAGEWAQGPEKQALNTELGGALNSAFREMPEKYRLILLLRDVEGLSNEEVATTLGLTVSTVKSRLHRSRNHMREKIEDYYRLK